MILGVRDLGRAQPAPLLFQLDLFPAFAGVELGGGAEVVGCCLRWVGGYLAVVWGRGTMGVGQGWDTALLQPTSFHRKSTPKCTCNSKWFPGCCQLESKSPIKV